MLTVAGTRDPEDRRLARLVALAGLDLHAGSVERVCGEGAGVAAEHLPADRGAEVQLQPAAEQSVTGDPEGTTIVTPIGSVGRLVARSTQRVWPEDALEFLRMLAGRIEMALRSEEHAAAMRRDRERAEALSFVAAALLGLDTLEDVLRTIAIGAGAAVAADHVRLSAWPAGATSAITVDGPMPDAVLPPDVEAALEEVHAEVTHDNYASLFTAAQVEARAGRPIGGLIVAPLRYLGRTIGFLDALRQGADFEGEDASLLSAMASQAVVAIENVRLADETQEALAELSAVYEIVQAQNTEAGLEGMLAGITTVVAHALPAHRVTAAVLEEDRVVAIVTGGRGGRADRRDVASIVDAALAEVGDSRLPAVRPGTPRTGPRLVIPLRNRADRVGVLIADDLPGAPEFNPRRQELALVMGSQIAVAIANALLFDATQRMATTDALTGVPNRRHLFALADHAIATANRYDRPLSCIMFDIDHFKRVNDTHGHAVGDEVLVAVAARVGGAIRDVDIVGRYGGEEFGVILPETDREGALLVAERLRSLVASTPIETEAGPIELTISLGVAEVNGATTDASSFFERADRAMYRAKRAGRNQVQG